MTIDFDPETGETPSTDQLDAGISREDAVVVDFQLNAREAAEYVSDQLGELVSASAFRQLVMVGKAPAPISGTDFRAIWSQAALSGWSTEQLMAAISEADSSTEPEAEEPPGPRHVTVYDFFERTYSPYYQLHDTNTFVLKKNEPVLVWCDRWWLHKSVVGRLVAAWYAWEDAHVAGGGAISSWILEHADRHFDRIMAEDGPFRKCKPGHTEDVGEYPTEPCPPALRLEDDDSEENKENDQ